MRILFVVLLLANVALYGYGQGWFGPAPSQRMREPQRATREVRPDAIVVPREPGADAPAAPVAPVAPDPATPTN